MKNAHPQLLLQEMQTNYPEVPTPALERYCGNYVSWRSALAEYTGWGVEDAKIEIAKIFYGARPATELPFLMQLR